MIPNSATLTTAIQRTRPPKPEPEEGKAPKIW